MLLVVCVLMAALFFEYINGFHDTANAIATTISTKVLTPRQAVALSAVFNLVGALVGTAVGGWRIIKTVGMKMVRIQPIHGFAAQTTASAVIHFATHWGIPLSTTHIISTSIMGVGATKRLSAVKWPIVRHMVWAWILTIPFTSLLGYALYCGYGVVCR